jgi:hypothetical protein
MSALAFPVCFTQMKRKEFTVESDVVLTIYFEQSFFVFPSFEPSSSEINTV